MSFDWYKRYKLEEWVEREVTESVYDYVLDYYQVSEVDELTENQIEEIREFMDEALEYSPIRIGFSNLLNDWESVKWSDDEE